MCRTKSARVARADEQHRVCEGVGRCELAEFASGDVGLADVSVADGSLEPCLC
jgi:hypothetical protein